MAALLDAEGVEQAVVVGLSLGGYLSLAFHAAPPQRTRALMLFDTGPGYRNHEARAGWNKYAESRAATFERDGLAALGSGAEVRVSSHRSAQGLAHAARGMLAQFNSIVIDSLSHVAVPTLVLVGAYKVVLEGAGHAANIDQPAAFNRAVQDFLLTLKG